MTPFHGDRADGGDVSLPLLERCPVCREAPELVAYDGDRHPLDIGSYATSGGDIVPSDARRTEYSIWRLSNAAEWRIVCGCAEPMVSCHRNSLIHRWNARSVDETL